MLVCGGVGAEAKAAAAAAGWDDVDVVPFPLACDPGSPGTVSLGEAVHADADGTSDVVVLGGHCLAALGDGGEHGSSARLCRLDRCLDLLAAGRQLDALIRGGAHLVTPGWLAGWRSHVRRWGFDQATAREFFAESATKVVLLDTGVTSGSEARLQEFAAFVGLPADRIEVGLDILRLRMDRAVLEWRLEQVKRSSAAEVERANRRLSDLAITVDVLGGLDGERSEAGVIDRIVDLLTAVCAPTSIVYLQIVAGEPGEARCHPQITAMTDPVRDELLGLAVKGPSIITADGFSMCISHQGEVLGALRVSGVALPAYRAHYLSLASTLSHVFALAVSNARRFHALEEALANVRTLRGLLPICSYCHKVRDDSAYWQSLDHYVATHSEATLTHGICPECYAQRVQPQIDELRRRTTMQKK